MSKWLMWIGLTALTGSPFLSIGILIVVWWLLDRYTLGILPDPFRFVGRFRRSLQLRRELSVNPHDRRARYELADLLLARGQPAAAVEVLKPNLEAGDDDAATLFLMGVACFGTGHRQQAEVFLGAAAEREPGFRQGDIQLELGRGRLAHGELAGAKEALARFCAIRHATVEGKVLLARAVERLGESAEGKRLRDEAYGDWAAAPRFQRRRERFWAWRAKPQRPIAFALVAVLVGALAVKFVGPALEGALEGRGAAYGEEYLGEEYDE